MGTASFRIRKTPTELEVEFTGESEVTLRKFEENIERVMKMEHGVPKSREGFDTANGQVSERRPVKRTGEQKAIRDHLTAMKSEGYFKQPRLLGEIRTEMRTRGWFHESPDLQYALLHNAVELGIKRISEGKNYKYVAMS